MFNLTVTKGSSLSESISETQLLLFERGKSAASKLGKGVWTSKTPLFCTSPPEHGIISFGFVVQKMLLPSFLNRITKITISPNVLHRNHDINKTEYVQQELKRLDFFSIFLFNIYVLSIPQECLRLWTFPLSAVSSPAFVRGCKPGAEGATEQHRLTVNNVGPRASQAHGADAMRSSLLWRKCEATFWGTFERSWLSWCHPARGTTPRNAQSSRLAEQMEP